jgi:hypothetical protein
MQSGLAAIACEDIVLSALAAKGGRRSPTQLFGDLKSVMDRDDAQAAFQALKDNGSATDGSGKAALTAKGAIDAESRFGKLPAGKAGIGRLIKVVWPALALGIDPKSKAAARLATNANLRAVALAVVFGLPVDKEKATLAAVSSALLVRGLAGLAGAVTDQRLAAVAQNTGDLSKPGALAKTLVKAGLALGAERKASLPETELAVFAWNVQAVADRLSTPPFSREVSISQVYDAYGRDHRDAGTLDEFKARLVNANAARLLVLYRLDEPGALDVELRNRSQIETPRGRYHFVARS